MSIFDKIPDIGGVPNGTYVVSIEDHEKTTTQEYSKLKFNVTLRVIEPKEFVDSPVYDQFTIGSDEDPQAINEETWAASFGARRMKSMIKASQAPYNSVNANAAPEDQMEEVLEAARGLQVCIPVMNVVEPEKNQDGSPNQYAGRRRTRIMGYYPLGSRVPSVDQEAAQPQPVRPKPAAPTRPAPSRAPVQPAAQPPPARPAAPRPAAPQRPAAPAPRAAQPAAPAPTRSAPPKRTAPAKSPQVQCAECGGLEDRATFPRHVDAHATGWQGPQEMTLEDFEAQQEQAGAQQ